MAENPSEIITIVPTPLEEYLDTILSFRREEAYPEVVLALAKATQEYGKKAVTDWLVQGIGSASIGSSFSPWLHPVTD
jgi:hypothetical protein